MSTKYYGPRDAKTIRNRYSIINIIRCLNGDESVDVGFEAEISRDLELARDKGNKNASPPRGFLIPSVALMRAFDKGTYGTGLVATDTTRDFISALASRTILGRAGMDVISGLRGDVKIPREIAVETYWLDGENVNATEVTPTVDVKLATPHTCGCMTSITRTLLEQTSGAAEDYVAQIVAKSIGRNIEKACLNGTGNDGQPLGILNTEGVQSVSLAGETIAKADVVEWVHKALDENADGANAWITTPDVLKALRTTDDGHNHYLAENGMMEGYPLFASNLCPEGKMIFADWSQLLLANWGELDLVVDRRPNATSGGVRVLLLQDVDVVVKNPKAFVVGTALAE